MENLEQYLSRYKNRSKEKSDDFVLYISSLLTDRGYTKDSDFYNKANISKQTWSNIMSLGKTPSMNTLLKIVFTLKCNTHECKYIFKKAGLTLASHSEYNLIIRYCIENKIYDLNELNKYLEEYGYKDSLIY